MKVILDTDVFIPGIFFVGPPGKILQGWRDGRFALVLSPEILAEYQQVAEILSKKYPPVDLAEMPELIVVEADMIRTEPLKEPVSADPDDDMFIACAPASGSKMIVSGDGHRLDVNDFSGIEILKTKAFADRHPPN